MSTATDLKRPLRSDVPGQMARARKIASGIARRSPRWCGDREALHGAALFGLAQALQRGSADMSEEEFDHYSFKRIVGAVLDEMREQDFVSREGRDAVRGIVRDRQRGRRRYVRPRRTCASYVVQQALGGFVSCDLESVESEIAAMQDDTPEDLVIRLHTWRQVEAALCELPPRHAHAVLRSYHDEALCKDIGIELGVTESRACQLRKEGLARLARIMGAA